MSDSFRHTDFDFEEFPKLIRDHIPEIALQKEGKTILTRVLDDVELQEYLFRKLLEEAKEAYISKSDNQDLMKELADLYEIIDTILALKQITKDQVLEIQDKKRANNGGFEKKLLMLGKE